MDHVSRPTLAEGHVQGVQNQLGSQMVGHRPADDPAAPDIHDDRQIEEARRGRDVGDVGDPQLVRAGGLEVAVHQIGRGSGLFVALRRDRAAAPAAGADQTGRAHQPGNPLAAVPLSGGPQLGMDTRCPIGLPRADVHRLDPGQQRLIRSGMRRGRAMTPGIVAGLRHAEHACHHGRSESRPGSRS